MLPCDRWSLPQVRARKATQAGLIELQPWTATWLQQQLPQQRLLLHALENVQGESVFPLIGRAYLTYVDCCLCLCLCLCL